MLISRPLVHYAIEKPPTAALPCRLCTQVISSSSKHYYYCDAQWWNDFPPPLYPIIRLPAINKVGEGGNRSSLSIDMAISFTPLSQPCMEWGLRGYSGLCRCSASNPAPFSGFPHSDCRTRNSAPYGFPTRRRKVLFYRLAFRHQNCILLDNFSILNEFWSFSSHFPYCVDDCIACCTASGALDEAIKVADASSGCSLILANDPDADRLAVAEKSTRIHRIFNINEVWLG